MTDFREIPITFDCLGARLIGIIAKPAAAQPLGVVIIVGGPQTRVGSHRQFVLLARRIATAGIATIRFDYRGMGDSSGEARGFEAIAPDIRTAIDALQAACPSVTRIALWGLCDAASAALLYVGQTRDPRIDRLCLINPWVRSETGLARTQVRHYYGRRLLQREFWQKLFTGKLNILGATRELMNKVRLARSLASGVPPEGFQHRMAAGLRAFQGSVLFVLSGEDFTAKEFIGHVGASPAWQGLLNRPGTTRIDVPGADHTFSSREWRRIVENACLDWLKVNGHDKGPHVA